MKAIDKIFKAHAKEITESINRTREGLNELVGNTIKTRLAKRTNESDNLFIYVKRTY